MPFSHGCLNRLTKRLLILIGEIVVTLPVSGFAGNALTEKLNFNRDVRPILADKCFHCHGPDPVTRKAELRLDEVESTLKERDGKRPVVPGHPEQSEIILRVKSKESTERMPPPDAQRQLTPDEIEIITRWVAQGGDYEKHWSLIPPVRPILPTVAQADWCRNPIDRFLLNRLEREGLVPAGRADRTTLIRRLTLDLTGLPPTPQEVDEFLTDTSEASYVHLVDRLLASPRFGERMALDWLDAARFADSGGYQGDIFRTMWPWRDWVIQAFNKNVPFDQFTLEQLAGDLLPNPTRDQLIATGFHRNHRINDEDGIILEEFRVEYVVDRVETTANVWLGLTLGCSRCHDHKYDPLSQADFYRFYAFFNSIDESGRGHGNAAPLLRLTTPQQEEQIAACGLEIESIQEKIKLIPQNDVSQTPRKQELTNQLQAAEKKRETIRAAAPVTMIMRELAMPRETFVLTRGAYDKPGEKVFPGLPQALPPLPAGVPSNRLGLAKWLVDPAHPLTSRVIVNRYWAMIFGAGLVSTPEDFGTQGEPPSHPELLDWLATEFVRSGWNVKELVKLIVTSSAYQQSSEGTSEAYRNDPQNRLLGRGHRYRLPAELIRDQALAASGLLTERLGGPSVLPYQPEGLWKELASAGQEYPQSHGADLYRRSMYTFWRRTVHHPAMAAFDAPAREICSVRRARTNTPIQALAMMNEPGLVEAARHLAQRVLSEAFPEIDARLTYAFRLVLAREPTAAELTILRNEWSGLHQRFMARPDDALKLLSVGETKLDPKQPVIELAAFTAIANTILNLDETLTRE